MGTATALCRSLRLLLPFLFVIPIIAKGQVVTTNGGSGLAATYSSLADAITALNAATITAPVTITLNQDQTAPLGGYVVTAQGSLANQLTIQGAGASPTVTVTAFSPQASGITHDAIFEIQGGDWITIRNFKMRENPANTTTTAASNNMTEWGVALLYATTTNGAQNNTIQNNEISLNRAYTNTFGIYSNSMHAAATPATGAAASTTGNNSGLKVYGNAISNVNYGIVALGSNASAPTAYADGLDIGGNTPEQGNTITDFGTGSLASSYSNVSGNLAGIVVQFTNSYNVSNNSITSSVGAVTGTLPMRGVYVRTSTTAPMGTLTQKIDNNRISLRAGGTANDLFGIHVETATSSTTSDLSISGNDFHTTGHTTANTGDITFISNNVPTRTCAINNNTFTDLSVNTTTGIVTFITTSTITSIPADGGRTVDGNHIVGTFNKTGAGGTVTLYSGGTVSSTAGESNSGNDFSNITLTGGTTMAGWSNATGSTVKTVSDNVFTNWLCGTSATTVMNIGSTGTGSTASGNEIGNITTSTNTFTGILCLGFTVNGNTIRDITAGTGAITGISNTAATSITASGNIIRNLMGAGAITGLSSTGASSDTFTDNTIRSLISTGASVAVTGVILTNGTTKTLERNRIYGLQSLSASCTVYGITVNSGTTVNILNNLIGDLRASLASGTNQVVGINLLGTTTSATRNVSYNTVYLNASSSATTFGTSGIYHASSTTATTSTLVLRNNIIVNASVPGSSSGQTVAYRRSAGAASNLANYGSASNNNLFYAGDPAANRLIYADGTSTAQTIAAYRTGMFTAGTIAPRDAASVTGTPTFLSVNGADAAFLHIDPTVPTPIESGGVAIGGITADYDGDMRHATAPDIGADEFDGTPQTLEPPTITYTGAPLGPVNACLDEERTLTATIVSNNPGGSIPTSGDGRPRLRWRATGGAWAYVTGQHTGGSTYTFTFSGGSTGRVEYYVVARDSEGAMGTYPPGGGGFNVADPPEASNPPSVPSSYITTLWSLNGTYAVGTSGPAAFATLTEAVAAYNAGCLAGPVIFELIDASYIAPFETFPITINGHVSASNVNTLTIRPATGVVAAVSSAADGALISFNGARYVTINGINADHTAATSLILSSSGTGTTANALLFINGAQYNTVTNCTVRGASTNTGNGSTGAVIAFSTPSASTGNSYNTISHCRIRNAGASPTLFDPNSALPARILHSRTGNPGAITNDLALNNTGNTIDDNWIFNYGALGATVLHGGVLLYHGNHQWTITNNRFFQEAARVFTAAANHRMISVDNTSVTALAGAHTIEGNILGFASGSGTGMYDLSGLANVVRGIYYSVPNAGPRSSISDNVINGIRHSSTATGSSGIQFFHIDAGQVDADNNRIGNIDGATATIELTSAYASGVGINGILNTGGLDLNTRGNQIGGIAMTDYTLTGLRSNSGTGTWTCTGNEVGGTYGLQITGVQAGASTLAGIVAEGSVVANIGSNVVRNLKVTGNVTGNVPGLSGIALTTTGTGNTVSGNTVQGLTVHKPSTGTLSTTLYGVHATSSMTAENNTIRDLAVTGASTTTSTATVYGIFFPAAAQTLTARNNTIEDLGISLTTAAAVTNKMNGIRAEGTTGTLEVTGNRIGNLRMNGRAAADVNTQEGALIGINIVRTSGTPTNIVEDNEVYDLENTGTQNSRIYATGIRVMCRGTNNSIARNTVYSIRATRGSAANAILSNPTGIWVTSAVASTANVVNNMVRLGVDADGTQEDQGYATRGIYSNLFSNVGSVLNMYHNSVYIGGAHATNASTQLSHALLSENISTRDIRNNILWNARNIAGTHYAMEVPSANLTSNNNDLRVSGSIGERHVVSSGTNFPTLVSWQTPTRDNLSISEDAPFVNATGGVTNVDLHLDVAGDEALLAQFNAGGVAIPGYDTDIDGQTRQNPPDIGADEICGTGAGPFAEILTWYADADEDGYGNPDVSVEACDAPVGYVDNDLDCDDNNAAVPSIWYHDADGDTYGNPDESVVACVAPEDHVADNTDCDDADETVWQSALLYVDADADGYDLGQETVCYGAAIPSGYSGDTEGTDCDDNDANLTQEGNTCDPGPGFENGSVTAECECVGTPIGGCTTDLVFETTAPEGSPLPTWQVFNSVTNALVVSGSGGVVPGDSPYPEPFCLPAGDFYIVVDGVPAGATYKVRGADAPFVRIIDNTAPVQDDHQVEPYGNSGNAIQLPMSETRVLLLACDKYWWRAGDYLVANEDLAVKAIWDNYAANSAERANTGYDFWFYDPNGTYSYVRQRRHNQADGYANVGSARTCHMRVNSTLHGWPTNLHIANGLPLNVRVRTVVNGEVGPWGPACRFVRDEALAACPPTTLWKTPADDPKYSCDGATRRWITHTNQRIFAHPVSGATSYKFRFTNLNEGYDLTRTNSTYYLNMGWSALAGAPLLAGSQYQVTVQAFKGSGLGPANDGWCTVGDPCTLTICDAQGNCGSGMIGGGQNSAVEPGTALQTVLRLWPNPNRGDQLFVDLGRVSEDVRSITMDVFDLSGALVAARTLAVPSSTTNTVVALDGGLAAGTYLVRVTVGTEQYNERLVIQP